MDDATAWIVTCALALLALVGFWLADLARGRRERRDVVARATVARWRDQFPIVPVHRPLPPPRPMRRVPTRQEIRAANDRARVAFVEEPSAAASAAADRAGRAAWDASRSRFLAKYLKGKL